MIKKQTKGFTLIEVMIAIVILGIGISFIYTIFPLGLKISREIQFLDTISFFAQKKFEGLKAGSEAFVDASGQESEFNWTLRIENYTTENNIVLKKAELDFLWIPGKAAIRKKSFFTYLK